MSLFRIAVFKTFLKLSNRYLQKINYATYCLSQGRTDIDRIHFSCMTHTIAKYLPSLSTWLKQLDVSAPKDHLCCMQSLHFQRLQHLHLARPEVDVSLTPKLLPSPHRCIPSHVLPISSGEKQQSLVCVVLTNINNSICNYMSMISWHLIFWSPEVDSHTKALLALIFSIHLMECSVLRKAFDI